MPDGQADMMGTQGMAMETCVPRSLLVFLKRPYGHSPASAYLHTSGS